MPPSTAPRRLSPDTLRQLRYEAKTSYYDMRICDIEVDVDLEDYIEDYIEDYYRAQNATAAPVSPSITPPKPTAIRRLVHRLHVKERAVKRSVCARSLPPEVIEAISRGTN
ncbi:hypothetical protein CMUS01_02553 [Colletotrichum musicola]|uniref:Uncharacterized protein n=1 Tax=Colletotrichum musicola TaxID=2175873 RepID=A0A8H6NV10_9PEZI|nr:hypothetical protein CMUS01_02553 [Colletotrichum musicola]